MGAAKAAGLVLVDIKAVWQEVVRTCIEERIAVLFAWDPLDHRLAVQRRERRVRRRVEKPVAAEEVRYLASKKGDWRSAWEAWATPQARSWSHTAGTRAAAGRPVRKSRACRRHR